MKRRAAAAAADDDASQAKAARRSSASPNDAGRQAAARKPAAAAAAVEEDDWAVGDWVAPPYMSNQLQLQQQVRSRENALAQLVKLAPRASLQLQVTRLDLHSACCSAVYMRRCTTNGLSAWGGSPSWRSAIDQRRHRESLAAYSRADGTCGECADVLCDAVHCTGTKCRPPRLSDEVRAASRRRRQQQQQLRRQQRRMTRRQRQRKRLLLQPVLQLAQERSQRVGGEGVGSPAEAVRLEEQSAAAVV